jgi:molybdenum cofactor cytidylyltransferase
VRVRVGVVLAAGRGVRAGGPKALARDAAGDALAVIHARALLAAGCRDVVVVVRADVARALATEMPPAANVVVSTEPDEDGPAGSLRAGYPTIQALGPEEVVVTPVDKRTASRELVDALCEELAGGHRAARPVHDGRGGHPVALRPAVLAPYATAGPPPLRDVLYALGRGAGGMCDVPWIDDVLDDLDTAEALRGVLLGEA